MHRTVFLECQECLTGNVDLTAMGDMFRCENLKVRFRPATQAEVDRAVT